MSSASAHRIVAVSMLITVFTVALAQDWVTALRAAILGKTQGNA